MTILTDLHTDLASVGLPIAGSLYEGTASNYIVLTELGERNDDIADDSDLTETAEADVNLYYVGDYETIKNSIISTLKAAGYYVMDRRYVEFDTATSQHHYVITVQKKEVI